MDDDKIKDSGGRRQKRDRRSDATVDPEAEKRDGKDRRCGSERRDEPDPVIRITGDERRKAYRELDILE